MPRFLFRLNFWIFALYIIKEPKGARMGNEKRMAAKERNRVNSVKVKADNSEMLERISYAMTIAYNINLNHYNALKKMYKTVVQNGVNTQLLDKLQLVEQKVGIQR